MDWAALIWRLLGILDARRERRASSRPAGAIAGRDCPPRRILVPALASLRSRGCLGILRGAVLDGRSRRRRPAASRGGQASVYVVYVREIVNLATSRVPASRGGAARPQDCLAVSVDVI